MTETMPLPGAQNVGATPTNLIIKLVCAVGTVNSPNMSLEVLCWQYSVYSN